MWNSIQRWSRDSTLLVSGQSGSSNPTVLRAIAGLWETGYGHITCPDQQRVFSVPQKPYFTLGELRTYLVYPSTVHDSTLLNDDVHLLDILQMLDLGQLPDQVRRLDAVADWADMLSLGEEQPLQVGRVIYRDMMASCDPASIDEDTCSLSFVHREANLRHCS